MREVNERDVNMREVNLQEVNERDVNMREVNLLTSDISTCEKSTSETSTTDTSTTETSTTDKSTTTKSTSEKSKSYTDRFQDYVALVPDPISVGQYNIHRGPCIDRNTKVVFVNGSISTLELIKPSEVLGCLQIPLDIAKAILAVPGSLLTVKVNNITDEKKYLQAQTDLLNAQVALWAAQQKATAPR